ncbi:UNVERIFIED_CONTAM: hypothetical protein PYX00_000112 [Menopon gallinae]|uniref:Uncharacterized protein n=1 Tax=Menopon gallinae TaxID=328185 RepID=A0AAW2I8L8_9NEOP
MNHDKEPLIINSPDCERGGESIVNDFAYKNNVANAPIEIRMGFLRKVYSLLALQLTLTVVFCATCMFSNTVQFFIRNNQWLVIVGFFASIGVLIALHVKRRHHPTNLFLLAAFTIIQSYTLSVITTYYDQIIVLEALFLTLAVQIGLTLFTLQSKRDFSKLGAGLFAGICILLVGEIIHIFVGGSGFEFALSLGGAFLFSLFIVYDTHMIMHHLSPEEYILATINLYLDIINLFLHILRILAQTRRQ